VGAGGDLYMYDVVVKKFTFAISSPDELLSPLDFTSSSAIAETARRTSYFHSQNYEVEFLSNPLGGLRGNVDASCTSLEEA